MPMLPLFICIGIGSFWNMYFLGDYINPGIAFMVYLVLFAVPFRPLLNIVGWIAITVFQVVVSIFLHSNSDLGVWGIVFEVILYISLIINLFFAFWFFKNHIVEIKEIKSFIVGNTFKLVNINNENNDKANINSTIITFDDEKQGKCIDFYNIKKFNYKIDTRVLDRKYPQIKFKDKGTEIKINLDYDIDIEEQKLRLGEEYAFNDDFRGYTDENGNLTLLIEPIYTFNKI